MIQKVKYNTDKEMFVTQHSDYPLLFFFQVY